MSEQPIPKAELPWAVGSNRVMIVDPAGTIIVWVRESLGGLGPANGERRQAEGTAAFIVRAANAHDELVDALLMALPFVEDHEGNELYRGGSVAKAVRQIRSALAKAGAL